MNLRAYNAISALEGVVIIQVFVIAYITFKSIYRLFLSPLAKLPGPALAASTKLYEAYHVLIKNDWLENLQALHRKYGPVVRIGPNELHFVDHEFCLDFHKRADLDKCDNYYGLLNKLLGGLASPQRHLERKAIIQPLFTGQTLAQFSGTVMNTHLDKFHELLKDKAGSGGGINATHYIWALTNDIMVSYLVGKDVGYLKAPDLQTMHDETRAFSAIDLATVLRSMPPIKMVMDLVPALRRYTPLGWLDKIMSTHLKSIIQDDREKPKSTENNSVLARLWSSIGDEKLVIHESAQAIFIGNESLLSNLTFLLHNMMQNPECIRKLRAELDTLDLGTYGYRVWRDPKVLQLKYLNAVCNESTRLSAPGWHRQPRQVSEPVNYQNTNIPPKASMSFTLSLLALDPVLYAEPTTFNPDRWIADDKEAQKSRSRAVAFGTGTRTCLGQYLARHVLRKTLACIVYNFNISLLDEERDRREGYRYLDTYPKKGNEGYLRLRLTPRFGGGAELSQVQGAFGGWTL